MSVQFGSWSFKRGEEQTLNLGPLRERLAPYGQDGESHFREDSINILVYHFHETEDISGNKQPFPIDASRVLTWDGRLDNREDLVRELAHRVRLPDSDVAVVAAAYKLWGPACLPKLVGDWALSIWDSRQQQLVLAKDFLGTRPLFYRVEKTRVQWSSVLDPLVLFAGRRFALNREYLAGWFGLFPASHLTPYLDVLAVPPASYVLIRRESVQIREFWQFSSKPLFYRNDAEYEEHFRHVFQQSLRRRLRSSVPVLAELSGGMDSSSIVCMADRVLRSAKTLTPRLDTISYCSSDEPNWDELPYIAKVEELRGQQGVHLPVRTTDGPWSDSTVGHFLATPGSLELGGSEDFEFRRILNAGAYRVVLSGIGGDEVLGGVPTPAPLLADLFVSGRWKTAGNELLAWALALRVPVTSLVRDTLSLFTGAQPASGLARPPAWLSNDLLNTQGPALRGYPRRTKLFGPRPSFQDYLHTLEALRRQLSCYPLPARPTYRKLYPYLDRDLLEFLFAIPPDQLLRPGQRRSLMRRALAGIVPQELLCRKRKAFVIRGPVIAISSQFPTVASRVSGMFSTAAGILLPDLFVAALDRARSGERVAVTPIIRSFAIERWFQNAAQWKVLRDLEGHKPA
jgi:asparagine synthase (glutamine-hydrolysing)